MSTLLVILPEHLPPQAGGPAAPVTWVLTHDGRTVEKQSSSQLDLLPGAVAHVRQAEIVAMVPVGRLSWHAVQLPPGLHGGRWGGAGGAGRLRTVLEGILEEALLVEPAKLHFALGPPGSDSQSSLVAVCDRAWLMAWSQALEALGLAAARIVPELAPGGEATTAISSDAVADAMWVIQRHVQPGGATDMAPVGVSTPWMVCPQANPNAIKKEAARGHLASALAFFPLNSGSAAWAAWPEDGAVLAEPAVAAEAERILGRPVQLVPQTQRWLSAARGVWDLAQFELASSRSGRRWRQMGAGLREICQAPRWRVARWVAAVAVVANLVGLNAWAWAQQQEIKAKQERVKTILTSAFPHVKVVIDAPLQMRREVGQLRRGAGLGGADDVDWMLSEVAQAVAPSSGAVPTAEGASVSGLEYSAGELRLQGLRLSESARQELRARLSAKGLEPSWQADVLTVRPKGPT